MRKTLNLLTVLFLVVSAGFTYGQYSLQINVNPVIPVLDFRELIPNGNVRGANIPELFTLNISAPMNQDIAIGAQFYWKDVTATTFELMAEYKSVTFKYEGKSSYSNRDLDRNELRSRPGSEGFRTVKEVLDKNIARGKPTGTYRIVMALYRANGPQLLGQEAQDTKEMTFSNPTQTLSISFPRPGDMIDEGNFRIDWTAIATARNYIVRGVLRTVTGQSPEDVLSTGQEVFFKMFDGTKTSANSSELEKRREIPANNKGIVFQVVALVPGSGADIRITSEPLDLSINTPSNSPINNPIVNVIQTLQNNPALLQAISSQFQAALVSGRLTILALLDETGTPLNAARLQQILLFLQQNPSAISNISLIQ